LSAVKKVSYYASIFGDFYLNCVFDCPHRGQSVCVRSDSAGALNKMLGVSRIAPL
jgi:hypothetical protein